MIDQSPQSWSTSISKAAWTLLLAAIAVFIAWQLLEQLVVPLVVIVALITIFRIALGNFRREGW